MHDPKYDEKPDHSHYAACAARSNEIYEFSRNVFVYTAGVCLVMLFITSSRWQASHTLFRLWL